MATHDNDIFTTAHNGILPARGSILISEPFAQDAYFHRSVVLLVDHDEEGSMGFVLNKKTGFSVNDFFPELDDMPEMPIYLGGPVGSNRLFFIHTLGEPVLPHAVRINNRLCFDGNFDALLHYIRGGNPVEGRIKFFMGYSGWTVGQLDREITRNSWIIGRASNRSILSANGEDFWRQSLESLGNRYEAWAKFPTDPCWN